MIETELDILRDVSRRLDSAGIAFMLSGSMAMNYYAQPRMTRDTQRRRQIELVDFQTWIVSREDLILSKLYWAKDSRSEMHLRDVRHLLADDCDMNDLRSHAEMLQVDALLSEVLDSL